MSNSSQFERLGQGEQISASQWNALSGTVEGLARTQTSDGTGARGLQMTRGPFGAVISSRTNPPFWVRITGKGDGLTTRLSQAVTAGDQWIFPSNLSDPNVSLLAPFEILVDGERLTVKEVAGSPLVPKWVLAGAASRSHDYGAAIGLPGTVPYAFVEVQQIAPGVWQNQVEGRWGLVEGQPTDADVVGYNASPPDATPDNSIALAGSVLAARASRTYGPAYEINGRDVRADGTVIVLCWLDSSAEFYLFQAPAEPPFYARLTSSALVTGVTTTLAANLTASNETVTVGPEALTLFPKRGRFLVQIGTELLRVLSGAGTQTWLVERAAANSTATTHGAGDTVSLYLRSWGWVEQERVPLEPLTPLTPVDLRKAPGLWRDLPGGRASGADTTAAGNEPAYGFPFEADAAALNSPSGVMQLWPANQAGRAGWLFEWPTLPVARYGHGGMVDATSAVQTLGDGYKHVTGLYVTAPGVAWNANVLRIECDSLGIANVQSGASYMYFGPQIQGGLGFHADPFDGGSPSAIYKHRTKAGISASLDPVLGQCVTGIETSGGIVTSLTFGSGPTTFGSILVTGTSNLQGTVTAGAGITAGGTIAAGGDVTAAGNVAAVGSVTGATLNGSYSGGSF